MSKDNNQKELDDNLAGVMRSLETNDARDQIVHTVCESKDVEKVMEQVCEKKLKTFKDGLTIKTLKEALEKENTKRYWSIAIITIIGVIVNVVITVIKVVGN